MPTLSPLARAFRVFLILVGIGAGLLILVYVFSFCMGVGAGVASGYQGGDNGTTLSTVISTGAWLSLGAWVIAGALLLVGLLILAAAAFAEIGQAPPPPEDSEN